MSEFHLRPYEPGDEISINAGFNEVFQQQRNLREWHWKFQDSVIQVAVDENQQVHCHYAALLVRMQVDGRLYQVGNGVDVYSRRQPGTVSSRLFLRTARDFFSTYGRPERVPFFYGFPGDRSNRLGKLKLGHGHTQPVLSWVKRAAWRIPWPSAYRTGEPSAEEIDQLWGRASFRYPVAAVRDAAWVQWRYRSHPGASYQVRGVWRGGKLRAWMAGRRCGKVFSWVDLVWDGQDAGALRTLEREGGGEMELWLGGDEQALQFFQENSWRPGGQRPLPDLLVLSFTPEISPEDISRRLYYTLGDSDLI